MVKYIQVITGLRSEEQAQKIADILVEEQLAACVQVHSPIHSTYSWKGKIYREKEWLCVVKTRVEMYDAVEKKIREHHTYEVPEIFAIPVVDGNESYLKWIDDTVNLNKK